MVVMQESEGMWPHQCRASAGVRSWREEPPGRGRVRAECPRLAKEVGVVELRVRAFRQEGEGHGEHLGMHMLVSPCFGSVVPSLLPCVP